MPSRRIQECSRRVRMRGRFARSSRTQPGEWAFGAGDQAITFVSRVDAGHYREEGRSWYRQTNGFGPTPGAATPAGTTYRIFDPSARHSEVLFLPLHRTAHAGCGRVARAPRVGSAVRRLPRPRGGARPVAGRRASAKSAAASRPRASTTSAVPATECRCVGMKHSIFATRGMCATSLLLLAASACFRESRGRLSCLTCHSPHAQIEAEPAAYDAACASAMLRRSTRSRCGARTCAGCHMPRVRPTPYLSFSNHRIAIYSASDPLLPVRAAR